MSDQSSADLFNRPPRIQRARLQGEITIPAPPGAPDHSGRNLLLALLPVASILLMGIIYLFLGSSFGRGLGMAAPIIAMGVATVLIGLLTFRFAREEQRRQNLIRQRDYHRMLDKRQARLQAARDLQLFINRADHPAPAEILRWVHEGDLALWNRRPGDDDFGVIPLGIGVIPSEVQVSAPDPDTPEQGIRRALDLAFAYKMLPSASITLDLKTSGAVGVVGEPARALSFMYAFVARLVAYHSPTDLNLYVFSSPLGYRTWNWTRWLPHTSRHQEGGFPDFIAYEPDHARELLGTLAQRVDSRLSAPQSAADSPITDASATADHDRSLIVAFFDDVSSIKNEYSYGNLFKCSHVGVIAVRLVQNLGDVPSDCGTVVHVYDDGTFRIARTGSQGVMLSGAAENLNRVQVELMARRMANLKLPTFGEAGRIPTKLNFLQMYAVERVADLNVLKRWSQPVPRSGVLPFPVPLGNDSFSTQLAFHLADNVHGPHGVIAGTTGSGKSELLQTLVTALALENHPYLVNFLLIDYKGGSTFNIFRDLPHTVGIITNLNAAEALRALEAIKSENRRRQVFLAEKGAEDITEYHKRLGRAGGAIPPDWDPLPHLCIIIDEFAELKTALPNFMNELVATVRLGRSLGMHLILATQRPSGHVTEEMRANLQFRICLRVQNPEASREMLNRPDAAYLPPGMPGRAYFQVGSLTQQFQVARVAMEYVEGTDEEEEPEDLPLAIRHVRYERPIDLLKGPEDDSAGLAQLLGSLPLAVKEAPQAPTAPLDPDKVEHVGSFREEPTITGLPSALPTLVAPIAPIEGSTRADRMDVTIWERPRDWQRSGVPGVPAGPGTREMPPEEPPAPPAPPPTGPAPVSAVPEPASEKIPLLAEKIVEQMAFTFRIMGGGRPQQVLLPSLAPEIPLSQLLAGQDYGGWNGQTWMPAGRGRRWACAPIGLVDDLASRAQVPLLADLHGQGGHMLIVGGPATGKTVLLRTVALSLAHLFRPDEIEMYVLSFAGHGLDSLAELPHVGAVICTEEQERIARLLHLLLNAVDERRRALAQVGADDLEQYNHRVTSRANLSAAYKPLPAIFVLIDNLAELRASFQDAMDDVIRLIRDGRAAGLHFVLTSPTVNIPPQIMSLIEQRLSLRLTETTDYVSIVGRPGERELVSRPGSGLLRHSPPLHVQVALPADGDDDDERDQNLRATIRAMRRAWGERPSANPVYILPESVRLELAGTESSNGTGAGEGYALRVVWPPDLQVPIPLPAPQALLAGPFAPLCTPIGLDSLTLGVKSLNWLAEGPHFLINGPIGSGKSTLLRMLLLGAAALYSPPQVWMLLVDFSQKSLRPLRNLPHVIDYVTDEKSLVEQLSHFQSELLWRREQARQQQDGDDLEDETSGYLFPPVIIAVDDYDQVRDAITSHASLFERLGGVIRRDSRLGFHLLIAGETSAMLAGSDQLLKQLRLTRSGFGLIAADSVEVLGGRVTSLMRREQLPVGRGYHVTRSAVRLIQFAQGPESAASARSIRAHWTAYPPSAWPHPASSEEISAVEQSAVRTAPVSTAPASMDFDIAGALEDYRKMMGYT